MNLLSAAYGQIAQARRAWFALRPHTRRRLGVPVVSVGNLSVGGSGKTPTVAGLARLLLAAGARPVILSRGYARREPAGCSTAIASVPMRAAPSTARQTIRLRFFILRP